MKKWQEERQFYLESAFLNVLVSKIVVLNQISINFFFHFNFINIQQNSASLARLQGPAIPYLTKNIAT